MCRYYALDLNRSLACFIVYCLTSVCLCPHNRAYGPGCVPGPHLASLRDEAFSSYISDYSSDFLSLSSYLAHTVSQ